MSRAAKKKAAAGRAAQRRRNLNREWHRVPEYLIPDSSCWQRDLPDGHLTVIVANEYGLVHLSISHRRNTVNGTKPGRYPTWAEIKDVRDTFTPEDVTMAMLLPPSAEYVNLHATTFHLWELRPDQVPGD